MEFHEKLQELRKQKGLTQEELAQVLFVSRAAVSKWESGRGYPNIDSLKAIAAFYGVTVDALLSGEELLTIAEENTKQKESRLRDLAFGGLDCGVAALFFLPFFRQEMDGAIRAVSLLGLTEVSAYLQAAYFALAIGLVLLGIATLALQNCRHPLWVKYKQTGSVVGTTAAVLLFMISLQPYAAAFLFLFLAIKISLLIKKS